MSDPENKTTEFTGTDLSVFRDLVVKATEDGVAAVGRVCALGENKLMRESVFFSTLTNMMHTFARSTARDEKDNMEVATIVYRMGFKMTSAILEALGTNNIEIARRALFAQNPKADDFMEEIKDVAMRMREVEEKDNG